MSQEEQNCYRPLWTSTLEMAEVLQRMWTSPIKGKCWQDLVVALPIKQHKMVEEKRRGCMRFFKKPKFVRVYYEGEGRLPKMGLVSIGALRDWVEMQIIKLNTEDRFVVSVVERGVLHVEWTEDPSEWSAKEILELPRELLVGLDPQASSNPPQWQSIVLDEDERDRPGGKGKSVKFKDQLLNAGYSPQAVSNLCIYSTDSSSIKGRTSGSGESLTITPMYNERTSIKDLIDYLAEQNATSAICMWQFKNIFQVHRGLRPTRLEMECIARLTDAFCYSAAFASPSEFVNDVLHSSTHGNTKESLKRFYDYIKQLAEEDRTSKLDRYYYVSDYHISFVPFDEGVSLKLKNILEVVEICEEFTDWKARLTAFKKNHRWGHLVKAKWAAYRYICHEYLGSAYESEINALWK